MALLCADRNPRRPFGGQNAGMGESRYRAGRAGCVVRRFACACLLLLQASAAFAHEVLIVASDTSAGYAETSEVLSAALQRAGVKPADVMQVGSSAAALDLAIKATPKVVVALGSEALRQVLQREASAPIVAGLIPRAGVERILREVPRRGSAAVAALYLDQPLGRQVEAVRQALPQARRMGVLVGEESSGQQGAISAAARQRSLEVSFGNVSAAGGMSAAVRTALEDVDVLFGVADTQVFNSATLANILLTAYRARIPVVAFSPAYVRAGALMAVFSTPAQIGAQLGQITRSVLAGATAPPGQYPGEFSVLVNEHVSRSLGLELDARRLEDGIRQSEHRP